MTLALATIFVPVVLYLFCQICGKRTNHIEQKQSPDSEWEVYRCEECEVGELRYRVK